MNSASTLPHFKVETMPLDDNDFISKAASLVSQCSPEQRERLVDMAQNFGKAKESEGGAQDARRRSAPMARDARAPGNPAPITYSEAAFPNSKRLK